MRRMVDSISAIVISSKRWNVVESQNRDIANASHGCLSCGRSPQVGPV
jgi:hypothetical protein